MNILCKLKPFMCTIAASNVINIFIKERDKNVKPQPSKFILRKTLDLSHYIK